MKRMRFIPWIIFAITACLGLGGCGGSYAGAPKADAGGAYRGGGYPGGGETAAREASGSDMAITMSDDSGDAEEAPPADAAPSEAYAKQAPAAPPAPKPNVATTPTTGVQAGQGQGPSTSEKRSPILIYTANFTLSVYEVKKSLDALEGLAKSVGGFVSRRDDRSITLRVPAADFASAVVELEKLGDVLNRNVVAEDVTAEYRDLEVQMQNLVALRARFEKLLEKAQKVEEALQIERELGRITGEIERIKGRIKVLADQAQYSTITVVFQPRSSQQIQDGPFILPLPWLNGLGLPRLLAL